MYPNIQSVGADLFSVQSRAAGASRICALLRVWQVHRASMLEDAEVALAPHVRSEIDFIDTHGTIPGTRSWRRRESI